MSMIFFRKKHLYRSADTVTDYKTCYKKALKVRKWIKKIKAYAIAFNQIGFKERCFVIRLSDYMAAPYDIIINPTFKPQNNAKLITQKEGCLSFPGETFYVKRWNKITMYYYNYELGKIHKLKFKGFQAAIIQHEISHLDGKPNTLLDTLRPYKEKIRNATIKQKIKIFINDIKITIRRHKYAKRTV